MGAGNEAVDPSPTLANVSSGTDVTSVIKEAGTAILGLGIAEEELALLVAHLATSKLRITTNTATIDQTAVCMVARLLSEGDVLMGRFTVYTIDLRLLFHHSSKSYFVIF